MTRSARNRSLARRALSPALELGPFRCLVVQRPETRIILTDVLTALRNDAASRAFASWRSRKAPMAAYWLSVSAHLGAAIRELGSPLGVAVPMRAEGRSLRELRNPVLALSETTRFGGLALPERHALSATLARIQAEAAARADLHWPRAPDRAAYWRAAAVYTGHLRRAMLQVFAADQHELLGACR